MSTAEGKSASCIHKMNNIVDKGWAEIERADTLVIKFGGDDARKFARNLQFVMGQLAEGKKLALVFSAIRSSEARFGEMSLVKKKKGFNTTDHLIEMAKAVSVFDEDGESNLDEAMKYFDATRNFTRVILEENFEEGELRDKMLACMEVEFGKLEEMVREACGVRHLGKETRFFRQGDDYMYSSYNGSPVSFTGFGEDLAEKLNLLFFKEMGVNVEALDSNKRSINVFGKNPKKAIDTNRNIVDAARDAIAQDVMDVLKRADLLVAGGRIPGAAESRGYSDVAGKIIHEIVSTRDRAGRTVLGIAKESTIRSGDPGKTENTELVERMNSSLSNETFGVSGAEAGAIHTDAVKRILPEDKIVVFVPHDKNAGSTLIEMNYVPEHEKANIVQPKKIPTVVEIASPDMVDRNGVVAFVAQMFSSVSIGHSFTKEGSILLTFNEKVSEAEVSYLKDELRKKFDGTYDVEPRSDLSMVFILANKMHDLLEMHKATGALLELGIRPIRFEGGANVIKFLVKDDEADKVTAALHKAVINGKH